jgi:hypothetical protein
MLEGTLLHPWRYSRVTRIIRREEALLPGDPTSPELPRVAGNIKELWDTPNDDLALSVRCAASAVASFMITPPRRVLDLFLPPDVRFIGEDFIGERFLAKRLRDGASASVSYFPNYHLHSDNARLRNIVCFLEDIRGSIQFLNAQLRTFGDACLIHQERRALSHARRTNEYCIGRSTFNQQGDRASPAFVHVAQQDLITLTL